MFIVPGENTIATLITISKTHQWRSQVRVVVVRADVRRCTDELFEDVSTNYRSAFNEWVRGMNLNL